MLTLACIFLGKVPAARRVLARLDDRRRDGVARRGDSTCSRSSVASRLRRRKRFLFDRAGNFRGEPTTLWGNLPALLLPVPTPLAG